MIVQMNLMMKKINNIKRVRKVLKIICIMLFVFMVFELDHYISLLLTEKYDCDPMRYGTDEETLLFLSEKVASIRSSVKLSKVIMCVTCIVMGLLLTIRHLLTPQK